MTVLQRYNFDSVSPSALLCCYVRQFSDIPYAGELAQKVNAQLVYEQLPKNDSIKAGGPFHEARYKQINYLIAKFGYKQIIELASGLLPRGIVMSENSNITFVETDLPGMIDLKKQTVTQLIGERPNLHFEAIDVTSTPNQFPIHADYLRDDEGVTIASTELLMHLTFPEKEQVCANVREILRHYGGVWITSDIVTKELLHWIHANRQISEEDTFQKSKEKPYLYNNFNDIEHVKQFFTEQGFCIEEYKVIEVIGELTCLDKVGIDTTFAEGILSRVSIFALTLKF